MESSPDETGSTWPKATWAHILGSCFECIHFSDLLRIMLYSAKVGAAARPQVVQVRSIQYDFNDEKRSLVLDQLEVEVIVDATKKTVVQYMQYPDVMVMDGGADAVERFSPIPHTVT
ncbi:uncharacterized protein N7511_003564 [Penicillium nucicola]|uniref:uncharacterized protein n=1 Tax=Penicillium nucicola TaxID=1850975 RepID=UPI002544F264|nr:uncharacterized protein N7511_003564 [Penicillium nucicola]KAJ5771513.1 hypothetical protein N7511_003564 [Penicillium nucicola]